MIISNISKYEEWKHVRGEDAKHIWRSGVKHDCSKVMELKPIGNSYQNGLGEIVDLENNYIFLSFKEF